MSVPQPPAPVLDAMAPTTHLRFVDKVDGFRIVRTLQQEWEDSWTGETEWRDVPLVEEGGKTDYD